VQGANDLQVSGRHQLNVSPKRLSQSCRKHLHLLHGFHVITAAQGRQKLALVVLHGAGTSQLLQLCQPVAAHGRAKPHIDEFRETLLGEDPQIAFKCIVPLGRHAVEMERFHPNPLICRSTHAAKVYGALVQLGQHATFTIKGEKGDLRTRAPELSPWPRPKRPPPCPRPPLPCAAKPPPRPEPVLPPVCAGSIAWLS
jgi:hypothetical protein